MSSMPSPEALAEAGIAAAVVQVAEQSFFAYAEPCDVADVEEQLTSEVRWLRAGVAFQGRQRGGRLEVVMPFALARDLAAGFGGCDAMDLTDAMVIDATGELCNMVCGLWLTRTSPHTTFALDAPAVAERGPVDPRIEKCAFMLINEMPAAVSVVDLERA